MKHGYHWTETSVRLFHTAQETVGFPHEIAKHLLPHLSKDDVVLDAGCGLGGLSLALAPFVRHVFSVDADPLAAASLRGDIEKSGIPNITALETDVFTYVPPVRPDVLVCCSFGHGEEIPLLAKRLGVKKVLWIKKDYTSHRFSKGNVPILGDAYIKCVDDLELMGIPFTSERFSVEAGQPLKDLAEARLFYLEYGKDGDPSCYTDEFLLTKLIPSADPRFQYYLPHQRRLALIVFNGEDIPV